MNLLVTGAWSDAKENIEMLTRLGHSVVFLQQETDALPCSYDWVEGVICNGLFLTHPIERFSNLRYIQLTSAGFDRVPMDYVKAHRIEICNARGVYSIPMAEFAVGGVLQLYKQSRFFADNQTRHVWQKHRGLMELNGKTVCIVGCGSVGTECAKRFKAFGCEVLGVDLFPREDECYQAVLPLDRLDSVLEQSDVLVLTLPLTEQTRHLMNTERFSKMKQGSVLVNIARGAVVDTDALIEALNTTLFGAVLDVFEEEPLAQSSPMWDMENVILTPHNSFISDGNSERLEALILNGIKKLSLMTE
ncbi:MAG: hydroxyacid dehydrogenase [Clostridia bacterium]|nr:hydroxyacid dehydrogenase [Clostridia bacterium]